MALLRTLPADIAVFAGVFGPFPAAQPDAFAHLYHVAPELDLDHVEVMPIAGGHTRLARYFAARTLDTILDAADGARADTLILLLPASHEGLEAPPLAGLQALGTYRGQVHRVDVAP